MVNVVRKRCEQVGCDITATHAERGATVPRFCATHGKERSMVFVLMCRFCKEPGCELHASWGHPGTTKKLFCREHAGPGMIILGSARCEEEGCERHPTFAEEGAKRARFCRAHTAGKIGMVDVINPRCEEPECLKQPSYAERGAPRARFCRSHAGYMMVDVRGRTCDAESCDSAACFGLPGCKASRCAMHRADGMMKHPRRRCMDARCTQWSTHGRTGPVRCEAHALADDANLVERACVECALPMVLDADGKCEICAPTAGRKRRRLVKQDAVRDFLQLKMPEHPPLSVDKVPAAVRACGDRERPDFLWDLGFAVVILEVDEDQHMSRPCECETARMINVSSDLAAPRTLWIRFNPDKYTPKAGRVLPENARRELLRRVLMWALEAPADAAARRPVVGVIHLCFDGFGPEDAQAITPLDSLLV